MTKLFRSALLAALLLAISIGAKAVPIEGAASAGSYVNIGAASSGNLFTEHHFQYAHITTSTTTVVKASAGFVHLVAVNTKGTIASTITVYDNTSAAGQVVAVVDSLNLFGVFIYDIQMNTGITVVTTGTVAPDVTVSYR